MIAIEFKKNFRGYVAGDVATFRGDDVKLAKELIAKEFAVEVKVKEEKQK